MRFCNEQIGPEHDIAASAAQQNLLSLAQMELVYFPLKAEPVQQTSLLAHIQHIFNRLRSVSFSH